MKHLVVVLVLVICCASYSQAQAGSLGQICSFYSNALQMNNSFVVGSIVNGTLTKIFANSSIVQYFNGTVPPGSPNFLTNNTALNILFNHLVQFFGLVLNCTDGSIGSYQGQPIQNIHVGLLIGFFADSTFNEILLSVLTASGVNPIDVNIVAVGLDGLRSQICFNADCISICNKYSLPGITSNFLFINNAVTGVLTAAVTPINGFLQFFNGTLPAGSPNFVNNASAYSILQAHFGQYLAIALGCSDGTIGTYQGNPLIVAHQNIPINNATFEGFNTLILNVFKAMNVTAADLVTITGILESTRPSICNQADCFAAVSTTVSIPVTAATTTATTTATKATAFNVVPFFALIGLIAYFFL